MKPLFFVLLAVGAILLVLYIREKVKACSVKAVLLKSVVSTLFIAVGLYGIAANTLSPTARTMASLVLLGQVFGLLGDIWLDLKYVFPEHDTPFTYAGFTVFGVGHLLFIIGLLIRYWPQEKPLYAIVPLVLGVAVSGVNLLLEKPMKLKYGQFKGIVFAYGVLLFSAVALPGSLALYNGWHVTTLHLFFAGTVLFALSDVVLSGTYFGEGRDRPIDIILNYSTYYPAQFLIASSLLFLQ